jgi:hypothetical protein
VAGIAARTKGKVLWCITRPDLFAPGLAQAGLPPDRVIYVEAGDDKTVLACAEEGLRHGGLGAVIAEIARLSMTASRRLQLCAEDSGAIGIVLRRCQRVVPSGLIWPALERGSYPRSSRVDQALWILTTRNERSVPFGGM